MRASGYKTYTLRFADFVDRLSRGPCKRRLCRLPRIYFTSRALLSVGFSGAIDTPAVGLSVTDSRRKYTFQKELTRGYGLSTFLGYGFYRQKRNEVSVRNAD